MEFKGSKTEKNLWEAFAGESMARNKYTYFASVAKKAGYEQIAAIFLETAGNEKEHAKLWFKALGELGDTAENLKAAAAGEYGEWTDMYPRMAKEAREEGFDKIACLFEGFFIEQIDLLLSKPVPLICYLVGFHSSVTDQLIDIHKAIFVFDQLYVGVNDPAVIQPGGSIFG
jgi:hypothetical protein